MIDRMKLGVCLLVPLILSGCGQRQVLAPVVDSHWRSIDTSANRYTVVRGDTLYAIAFRYDKDYRQLAALNGIKSPYSLRIGQVIRLRASAGRQDQQRFIAAQRKQFPQSPAHQLSSSSRWVWPARGKLVSYYAPQNGKKGIDISGRKGDVIYATESGRVAYAGSGLPGYGNLIIIKHANHLLSAYGNNAKNLVKEGQFVKAGQVIATMGVVDRKFWGLHFEIRRQGEPVNPLGYLKR